MCPVDLRLVFRPQSAQADLRCCEPHCRETDGSILAGIEAILNDGYEAGREVGLIAERYLTLCVTVEREIGDGSILGDRLTRIAQRKIRRGERIACGANVVGLREVED